MTLKTEKIAFHNCFSLNGLAYIARVDYAILWITCQITLDRPQNRQFLVLSAAPAGARGTPEVPSAPHAGRGFLLIRLRCRGRGEDPGGLAQGRNRTRKEKGPRRGLRGSQGEPYRESRATSIVMRPLTAGTPVIVPQRTPKESPGRKIAGRSYTFEVDPKSAAPRLRASQT